MTEEHYDPALVSVSIDQAWDDMMQDDTLTPMFFARRGFMVPVLDEEGKDNSWQKVLRNNH